MHVRIFYNCSFHVSKTSQKFIECIIKKLLIDALKANEQLFIILCSVMNGFIQYSECFIIVSDVVSFV